MDDILDELGGNVTYQDLYKIHTGHGMMNGNSDTDASSESGLSNDDNLKPPPYTYEELTQNLVPIKGLLAKEFDEDRLNMTLPSYSSICAVSPDKNLPACTTREDLNSNQPVTREDLNRNQPVTREDLNRNQPLTHTEKVVRQLSQLITTEYCFICDMPANKHYKQQSHYKNVINWLETETRGIKQPVDLELFFCQICNLPLPANEKSKEHYEETEHKEKAKSFCIFCQRVIEAIDMRNHCKSKKHLANVPFTSSPKSESVENKEKASESTKQQFPTLPGIVTNLQDKIEKQMPKRNPPLESASENSTPSNLKSYAGVLRGAASNKNTTMQVKTTKTKKSEPSMPSAAKEEHKIIRTHILPPAVNPFAVLLIEQLRRNYCYLCDESVSKERGSHYKKKVHYKKLREWVERDGVLFGYNMNNIDSVMCFACHCIFPTFPMAVNHYRTKEHEKLAQFYCDVCMYHDNSDIHKEHKKTLQMEPNLQKACELRNTEQEAGAFIANKLRNLFSQSYCYLCKTNNDTTHELTKVHLKTVRRWLEIMIKNTGVKLNRRYIFCEDCSMVLAGTNESQYHFETNAHLYNQQTYCPVCMFRASPEDVAKHLFSDEHNKNLETLLSINMPVPETIPNVTNNKVANGYEDGNTIEKKNEQTEPELSGEVEKAILNIDTPKLDVHSEPQNATDSPKLDLHSEPQNTTDSEIPKNLSDHQNMNLVRLGLQLGRFFTDKVKTDNKEHAALCKDIFKDYWKLVTMLEIIPLEVCSSYLKKFSKDILGVYREYLNNLDKNRMERRVISRNVDGPNVQDSQPNKNVKNADILEDKCLCDEIVFEMTRITSNARECLGRKFSPSSVNMVRRLLMLLRNFRTALEGIKGDGNGLKMENIFQFSSEYYSSNVPSLEENVDAVGYEVYKFSLIQEIELLSNFSKITVIKPNILLDCLKKFGHEFLKEIITCIEEEKNILMKAVFNNKINTEVIMNNGSLTNVDEDKDNTDDNQTKVDEDKDNTDDNQAKVDEDKDNTYGNQAKLDEDKGNTDDNQTKGDDDKNNTDDNQTKVDEDKDNTDNNQTKVDDDKDNTDNNQTKVDEDKDNTDDNQTKVDEDKDNTYNKQTKVDEDKDNTYDNQTKVDEDKDNTDDNQTKVDEDKDNTYNKQTKVDEDKDNTYDNQTKVDENKDNTNDNQTKVDEDKDNTYNKQTKVDEDKDNTYDNQTKVDEDKDNIDNNQTKGDDDKDNTDNNQTKVDEDKDNTDDNQTKVDEDKDNTYNKQTKVDEDKDNTYDNQTKVDEDKDNTDDNQTKVDEDKDNTYNKQIKVDEDKDNTYDNQTKVDENKDNTDDNQTKVDEDKDNTDDNQTLTTDSLKNDGLLCVPKTSEDDIYLSYDSETEKDSDTSFESADECLCEEGC